MNSFLKQFSARLVVLLSLYSGAALAQPYDDVPVVTRTFAIENARIVQAPGRTIERGTVVVRDGLIEAVGAGVEVPFDAERIAGDSLIVYAGFIDGLSHAGFLKPAEESSEGGRGTPPDVENPGDPPHDVAGIQPERHASEMIQPDAQSIEALREVGFTAAHVAAYGGLLPGSGAVVLLTGDDVNAMVFEEDASLVAQFEGGRRVYPATPMGIMAKFRDLYREAVRRRRGEALYAQNPVGMARPSYDPVYAAFFPVIGGEKPVFFYTEGALEARRALTLHRDLGFPLVLAGLDEAFALVGALEEAGAPLLLTLDLPEADSAAATDSTFISSGAPLADDSLSAAPTRERAVTPEAPGSFFVRDYRTRSYQDVEGEEENLKARQEEARRRYYATAAELHQAGLRFGFTTWGAEPGDVRENLRTMIEHGLPEEAALAALTTNAADVLGLTDRLGTVEEGKIANLVVTTSPYFDEESQVRYVFVDGQKFEIEPEEEQTSGGEGEVNPAGTWSYTVAAPEGDVSGTITLSGSPDDLSGTLTSEVLSNEAELQSVNLDGDTLTFSFNAEEYGRVDASVTLDGDRFEGTLDVSGETYTISGTRTSEPDER